MRWSLETAEALLRVRAVYLSGDLDSYWAFHARQEQQRLYRKGQWRVVRK
jgi:hypothetical protein